MVSEKKRKQQLKAPDEFQKKVFVFADWVAANQKPLILGVSITFIIIAGTLSWRYIDKQQSSNRREEVAQIDKVFTKENEKALEARKNKQEQISNIEKRLQELTKQKMDTPESAQLNEQKLQLTKSLETIKPDHQESAKLYQEFYNKFKEKPAGWRAALTSLNIQVQNKNYKAAGELAKDLLSHAKKSESFFQFQVRFMYISILEEIQNYPEALLEAKKLLDFSDDNNKPKALLAVARTQLLSEQKEAALTTLDKLINEHNSSPEAQKAKALKYVW